MSGREEGGGRREEGGERREVEAGGTGGEDQRGRANIGEGGRRDEEKKATYGF
jgi:hypothetical protein